MDANEERLDSCWRLEAELDRNHRATIPSESHMRPSLCSSRRARLGLSHITDVTTLSFTDDDDDELIAGRGVKSRHLNSQGVKD